MVNAFGLVFSMNARPNSKFLFCNNVYNFWNKWNNSVINAYNSHITAQFRPSWNQLQLPWCFINLKWQLSIVACISAVRRTFLELQQSWSDSCNKLYNGTYNVYNSTGQLSPAAFHGSCAPTCWLKSSSKLNAHFLIIPPCSGKRLLSTHSDEWGADIPS